MKNKITYYVSKAAEATCKLLLTGGLYSIGRVFTELANVTMRTLLG